MNTFRARWFSSVLLGLLASAVAVPPAIAQKPHQKLPPGKTCTDCHKRKFAEWKAGPHGANQVECIVCHGNVTENFTAKPKLSVCAGCHAELVAQLKSDPFMNRKTCVTCHTPHTLKPHQKVAVGDKG